VSVSHLIKEGFLPEALINIVALLGWGPENCTDEVFTIPELIERFSLSGINKASSIVSERKMTWLNNQHIRKFAENSDGLDNLLSGLKPILKKHNITGISDDYSKRVLVLMKERIIFVRDLVEQHLYFFEDPDFSKVDPKFKLKAWKPNSAKLMNLVIEGLENLPEQNFSEENIYQIINRVMKNEGLERQRTIFDSLRFILTAEEKGPSVYDIMNLFGKNTVLNRLRKANEIK